MSNKKCINDSRKQKKREYFQTNFMNPALFDTEMKTQLKGVLPGIQN
jgi:hypothetical protein